MAITIAKDVTKVVARAGGAFVSDDDGTTYYDLGIKKGGKIEFSPIETEEDDAGRTVMLAADVTLTAVLQQTDDTAFVNLAELNAVATNGLWIKFTSEFTNAAGAGAADGYTFKNAFPIFSGEINFNNTESMFTMTAKGRVSVSDLAGLGDTNDLTFDG